MLYNNYGITVNSKLKLKNITKLLIEAENKEVEDKLWELWKLQFPNMDEKSYVSFEDYKNKTLGAKIITDKSDEEILKETLEIRNKLKLKKEEVCKVGS